MAPKGHIASAAAPAFAVSRHVGQIEEQELSLGGFVLVEDQEDGLAIMVHQSE
jgi:hypothetical protein